MADDLTACPICRGEVSLSAKECPFCGALFAGTSGGRLIQKGLRCRQCGQRTYSTEVCTHCETPVAVSCPSCGKPNPLLAARCQHCEAEIPKFGRYRRRAGPRPVSWVHAASLAAIVLALLAAISFLYRTPPAADGANGMPGISPPEQDTDGDGRIDRWEFRDAAGALERVETDENRDGRPDQWVFLDAKGEATRILRDRDGNGIAEEEETHEDGAGGRRITRFSNADGKTCTGWTRFRADGKKFEEALDENGDTRIDRQSWFTQEEKKFREATDTDQDGRLDEYATFNPAGDAVRIARDADGDGIFEYEEARSAAGQKIWEKFDENRDGLPEKIVWYYAGGGIRQIELDENRDGNPEITQVFADGVRMKTGYDTNGDTKPDWWKPAHAAASPAPDSSPAPEAR